MEPAGIGVGCSKNGLAARTGWLYWGPSDPNVDRAPQTFLQESGTRHGHTPTPGQPVPGLRFPLGSAESPGDVYK